MIKVTSVTKSFQLPSRTVLVCRGVSFEVKDGEFVTLIGPSGSGKTTMLRIIAGLETHDDGSVEVGGVEVAGPGPDRAVVFQQFALLPWMSVEDNISFGLRLRGVGKQERTKVAASLVKLVGLTGFERSYPRELSGGMQQRVGLARALAVDPAVLLMDEPFASLDEQTRFLMQEELLRIWEPTGKTVLFVTHSMEEATLLSDRIIVLAGRPSTVREIITVPFGRPRDRSVATSFEFQQLREHIWELLKPENQDDLAPVTAG